jgi:signal transduction histidine kinase/ligand-binding sensor domain-containing protein
VSDLFAARDGTLWIGTYEGLASLKNGRLTQYPALSKLVVLALLEDRDGTVWVGLLGFPAGKICSIRNGSITCYGDDGRFGNGVISFYQDPSGVLWAGAASGLWRWKPGDPPTRYLSTPFSEGLSLVPGDHGSGLVVILKRGVVHKIVDGKLMDYPLSGLPSPLTAKALLRDRRGGLWIGTDAHGVVYTHEGKTRLITHSDGLSSDQVMALFEDREGTIWIATSDGLDSFHELPVASLSAAEGLSSNNVGAVLAAKDGSIWIGTRTGLNRWQDGHMKTYRAESDPGLRDDEIGSLFEDEGGRIWVSTDYGLASFQNGRFTAVPGITGEINSIAGDHRGGLWLSDSFVPEDRGLVHVVNGKVTERMRWESAGGTPGSGLVADERGGVWTGLLDGGIAYFHAGQIRKLELGETGPGTRRVFNLLRARDGALWAAGEGGLSRIADGRVATLTTANGLPCNAVHWIIEDDVSSYWVYTRCGLLRIPRNDLNAWIVDPKRKVEATTFDSTDGIQLIGIPSPFRPHVTKASDGRIWFQNGNKVGIIDPSSIGVNTLPPPVHIEQITADDKTYYPAGGLRLAPLVRNLTIDYTALSLVAPGKVHFRYKLEGQDPDWREVINDREVQYSNLPPARYRFRVIACNNSGVWNEQGDTLEFSVDPAYYQTNWFRAMCAVAVIALLWLAYRFRVRQVRQEITIGLEAKISERTRIARDLHDTLLQSFHGLLYRFNAVRNFLPDRTDEAMQELDSALIRAEQALDEGRQSIQELRSGLLAENQLDQMLIAIGQELASSHQGQDGPPSFKVIEEGERRALSPIIREEILHVTRELLLNAFRHACAHAIEVEIRYGREVFGLIVRDDGKGIDPKILKDGGRAGHFGMPGVYERARGIGARLEFWSEAGAGTEVRLTIPGAVGYERSPNRPRFVQLPTRRKS